eukprot:12390165-Alexandrium_andersonii.AAC.2
MCIRDRCLLRATLGSLALWPAFPTRGPELPEGLGCSTHGRGRALLMFGPSGRGRRTPAVTGTRGVGSLVR